MSIDVEKTSSPVPPLTIEQLERRRRKSKWWQFSLWELLLISNLLGLILAVVIATRGEAIVIAIAIGMVVACVSPIIVFIGLFAFSMWESRFGRRSRPIASRRRKQKHRKSPFND